MARLKMQGTVAQSHGLLGGVPTSNRSDTSGAASDNGSVVDVDEDATTVARVMKQLDHSFYLHSSALGILGFRNGPSSERPNNMCYRNAAISMLLNLPIFSKWLLSHWSYANIKAQDCAIFRLRQLARRYWPEFKDIDQANLKRININGEPFPYVGCHQEFLDETMHYLWTAFLKSQKDFTRLPKNVKDNRFDQEDTAEFITRLFAATEADLGKDL